MLILRKISLDSEGIWVKQKVRGEEIELKIRPFTPEIGETIRKKHRHFEFVKDLKTRQSVKTEVVDEKAVFTDMVDYVLEDFRGIGYSKNEPMEPTPENKLKVIQIPPGYAEQPLWDFIIDKARELAVVSEEKRAEEIKNL